MDIMGLLQSTYYPINIHINSMKPDKESAIKRFINNFYLLNDSCKKRLTVENDDSQNQYSVKQLYDNIYKEIKIPIVFDQHHHNYGPQDQSMERALKMAISTWETKPLTHMSSPGSIENKNKKEISHADFIYEKIQDFGMSFDTEIEAKAKDLAVIDYREKF